VTTVLASALVASGAIAAGVLAVALLSGECATAGLLWRLYARWAEAQARLLFLRWRPGGLAARHAGAAGAAALGGALIGGWPLAVVAACATAVAGFRWPALRQRRRRQRLEAQLDPTLRSMAQTMRVTANLTDAMETIAGQIDPPMSEEIDLCLRQYRLGLPIEDALAQMARRVGSSSLETATTAIAIGRMTGGDLPSLLEEVAATLRERIRLDGLVETKTAEGKAQAWIMGLMPPALAALLWHLDPDMMVPLPVDPAGWATLGLVAVLEVVGVVWVRRVTAIEA